MTARTVNQSGGPAPDYSTLNAAVAASTAADTIEIQGTWSADDTTQVTWNVAVIVTADSSSQQIGAPWVSGGTEYRHRVTDAVEHAFIVTADVDITGINIQSDATGAGAVSDELFRAAGAYGCVITNCMLGFTTNTDQQDIWYTETFTTRTLTFEQCFFYDVGRSIIDNAWATGGGTLTINFNSCGSFNIGADGARYDGCWYGQSGAENTSTINVNAHNCLIHVSDLNAFALESTSDTFNIDCTYSIANIATTAISVNEDSEDLTGTVGSRTWATSTAGGDEVLLTNITSGTYNPALVNDATNNDAQTFHAVVTDAGLTIPTLDILGQERDKATPSFDCGPSALTLAAGGGTTHQGPLGRVLLGALGGPI